MRLDARREMPRDVVVDALKALAEELRRWAGEPAEPDTGERAPLRQRVPA